MKLLKLALATVAMASTTAFAQPDFGADYYGDPCNGTIQGTWGYKGGRSMEINLIRRGRTSVIVTVSQANGGERLNGTCVENRYGEARVEFNGGINNGSLRIDSNGNVRGVVANYSFNGYMN